MERPVTGSDLRLGLDLGGSKIEGILMSSNSTERYASHLQLA